MCSNEESFSEESRQYWGMGDKSFQVEVDLDEETTIVTDAARVHCKYTYSCSIDIESMRICVIYDIS